MKSKKTFIIAGSSNLAFAQKLALGSGIPLGKVTIGRFSNGEAKVRIEEPIYNNSFYVIQSLSQPVDEHIMELCLLIDALKRGGAAKIVAVVPWFGYGIQDKVFMPGEALSAKVVIDFLQRLGIHSLITIDLHSDNIIGFFEVPVVHLTAIPLFARYILRRYGKQVLVVSPDFGGAKRARRFAKELGQSGLIGIIDKERCLLSGDLTLRGINLEVKEKIVVLLDDFVSTGSTLIETVKLLKKAKASSIVACISHPILAGQAAAKIGQSSLTELVTTNTIVIPQAKQLKLKGKLRVISVNRLVLPYII